MPGILLVRSAHSQAAYQQGPRKNKKPHKKNQPLPHQPSLSGTAIGLVPLKRITMEPVKDKKIDSPAWQNPAPGNEQNDSVKGPQNETIKTGGNSRTAEDDLDLDKQPYVDGKPNEEKSARDFNEDPDERPI